MNDSTNQAVSDLLGVLSELKTSILQVVPSFASSFAILIVGVVVAYLLKWLSIFVVRWGIRVLPKKLSDQAVLKANTQVLVSSTGKVVFFVTIFLAITTALKRLGLEVISSWFQGLAKNLPNIVVALVIVFLGWKLKDLLVVVLNRAFGRADFAHSRLASNSLSWAVFAVSALVALEQVGIDMGLIVTISSVLVGVVSGGVALMFALGAKSTISDILGCYQIQRYLKKGQKVEVLGFTGDVESIGPTFVLLDTDRGKVAVPGNRFRQEVTLILDRESGHS